MHHFNASALRRYVPPAPDELLKQVNRLCEMLKSNAASETVQVHHLRTRVRGRGVKMSGGWLELVGLDESEGSGLSQGARW